MSKNYVGVEDLLCDETFLAWYFKTDAHNIAKWEQWIVAHPDRAHRIEQAVAFLDSLRFQETAVDEDQITQAESLLLDKIRRVAGSSSPSRISVLYLQRKWWAAAAILILLTGGTWQLMHHRPELATKYGEVKNNNLPDGTEVVVNADSRITYSTGWQDGKDREVWLKGEAFFHVRKTPLKSRFIVHTDHFDVIVTGTQFNVIDRGQSASVMLQEGSVTLHTRGGKEWKMAPGDFVQYNEDQLEKRSVRNDSVLAWKEHKLIFDNTPLQDVAQIIREHYGVTVHLEGDGVANRTISGILANDNLGTLLKALEAASEVEIVHQGDDIIIKDHP